MSAAEPNSGARNSGGDLSISSPVRKNSRTAFVVSCDQFWRPPRALSKKNEANVLRNRIVFIAKCIRQATTSKGLGRLAGPPLANPAKLQHNNYLSHSIG